jgi:hypothetical protein
VVCTISATADAQMPESLKKEINEQLEELRRLADEKKRLEFVGFPRNTDGFSCPVSIPSESVLMSDKQNYRNESKRKLFTPFRCSNRQPLWTMG